MVAQTQPQNADLRLLPTPHVSPCDGQILTFEEIEQDDPDRQIGGVETDTNVLETVEADAPITQFIPTETDLPKCLWCNKPFHGRSNKRFCTPSKERSLNFKRRQALTTAVAEQFKQWGWYARTGTLQDVAKKCVDAEYERFLQLMPKLGWKYHPKSSIWSKG